MPCAFQPSTPINTTQGKTNIHLFFAQTWSYIDFLSYPIMPAERKRKRPRFETPPPVVVPKKENQQEQLETPQLSAVFAVLYFCEQEGIHCPLQKLQDVFNIPLATSHAILKSKRARRLQNSADEPDPRGAPRQLTNSDANAIASYIDQCPFDEKGYTWEDLQHKAGVEAPDKKENFSR